MKRYVLRIREVDRVNFDSIKDGSKIIETRAATDKYRKIKAGDVLVFVCVNDKLEKEVEKVDYYKSIDEMVEKIDFKSVTPFLNSVDEMRKMYYSFPGYKDKINKLGLVAFKLK